MSVRESAVLDERLQDVFRAVFGSDLAPLKEEDSPATVKGWDSLNHVHLMLALESEFGVQFDADEIAGLTAVGAIRRRLAGP